MSKSIRIFDKDVLNRMDGTKHLMFRNFSCRDSGQYKSTYPNFNIVITDECADYLREAGFNVVDYPDIDGNTMHRLKINVRFDNIPPMVFKKCGNKNVELKEDTIADLDRDEIVGINLWINLSSKGACYLSKGIFEIVEDDFYKILYQDEMESDYID